MLERLGRAAARRHRLVIGAWLVLAVAPGRLRRRPRRHLVDVFTIPGTQSQQASDLLQQRFPAANGASAQVVFHAPSGTVTGPAQVAAINASVANLAKVPERRGGDQPHPARPSPVTSPPTRPPPTPPSPSPPIVTALPPRHPGRATPGRRPGRRQAGLSVQYGGAVVDHLNQPTSSISEHADDIGLAIAVIILLVALGSVVSMAVPISLALIALLCSSLLLKIIEAHLTIGHGVAHPRHHDRPRRRHRLLAVHREPPSPEPGRGHGRRVGGRAGPGHLGLGRAVRRHDRVPGPRAAWPSSASPTSPRSGCRPPCTWPSPWPPPSPCCRPCSACSAPTSTG